MRVTNESADEPGRSLRAASRSGQLPEYLRTAPAEAYAVLYEIISALVYEWVTRPVERRRGHHACASSVGQLEPDCHDRYQDDVAAVREDVLRHANVPIANLEGWIITRLRAVTIDAHRRRRGESGAHQRPRLPLPGWLAAALGHDKWREALAVEILTWVGIPISVPNGLWPLRGWADRRATITGEYGCTEVDVAADVETVLAAMRTKMTWYNRYVERPLGRKQAPVALSDDAESGRGRGYLALVEPYEAAEARLIDLAAGAVDAIVDRLRRGEEPRKVVTEVVGVVFRSGTGVEEMDRPPGTDPVTDETAALLLTDPATVDRIVAAALDILGES